MTLSTVKLLDSGDLDSLREGTWLIVTNRYNFGEAIRCDKESVNYGVLIVNSMETAKIAALLGLTNPAGHVLVEDGQVGGHSIDGEVPIGKIIDYFVYYWAVGLSSILKASTSATEAVELFAVSISRVFYEIFRYSVLQ